MPSYICTTCGAEYEDVPEPRRATCRLCDEERSWVDPGGQRWTTLAELGRTHSNVIRLEEPGLVGIGVRPSFAVGQRALLVRGPDGNVLWDCINLIDDYTVEAVRELGGVSAIAVSHPHFYSSMVEWSRAFGGIPIFAHAADRRWVCRPDAAIVYWDGERHELAGGLTLVGVRGHFAGASVLHWPRGAGGRGVLMTGDAIHVVEDRRWVSFMYSFPNLIPLSADAVRRVIASIEPF